MSRRSGGRGSGRRGGGGGAAAPPFDPAQIPGGAVYLDQRDVAIGALTSWIDRFHGYDFAGNATRASDGVGFNGSTDVLTSTAAIAQFAGAPAVTWFALGKDTQVSGSLSVIAELSSAYLSNAGSFCIYANWNTTSLHQAIFGIAQSRYQITESLATEAVYSGVMDFRRVDYEAGQIRKNGTQQTETVGSAGVNASTTTFGSYALSIGNRAGGTQPWTGKLRAFIAYARVLSATEIRQVETYLTTLTTGLSLTAERASLGDAFISGGQSNMLGQDPDLTSFPSPWPPVDTAARLFEFPPLGLAVEPFSVGGSPHTTFLDTVARDPRYTGNLVATCAAIGGSKIASWQTGQANYLGMLSEALALQARGWRIRALLWYQGENDTLLLADRNAFKAATIQSFATFRSDMNTPDLPVIMTKLHPTMPDASFPYWADVRTLQDEIGAEQALVTTVAAGGTIFDVGPAIHLSTTAERTLGADLAAAYLALPTS